MEIKDDVDSEQLADWLDDNSKYACYYVGTGRTLYVIEN